MKNENIYTHLGTISAKDFLKLLLNTEKGYNEVEADRMIGVMVMMGVYPEKFTVDCQKDAEGHVLRILLEGKA